MLGGQRYRGTRFSRYDDKGNDSPNWQGTTCDMLMKFLDSSEQEDDKKLAASILTFCAARAKSDPATAGFWNELEASAAWEHPDSFQIRDTVKDGRTRREVVCIAESVNVPPSSKSVSAPLTVTVSEEI